MNANLDLRNAVLIHRLPYNLQKAGAQALAESISIPLESVVLMKSDHWGVKVILDNDTNFKKMVLKGFLEVSNITYLVYPAVTDLAICGAGPNVDEAMVTSLLKPFAPVLLVYKEKNACNGTSAGNYRGVLFHPEIPEEIKKWTCIKLKSGATDNAELSITFFCRFCRQYGHTRHECNKVKLQNSLNVETQDSSVTSSSNAKKTTKTCTSPGKNSLPNSLPKIFRNPETDQNKKVPPQKNETEFRISERGSELSSSFNFIKLIPPSSKKDIIHLKKFILDDDIQDRTYKAALRYPDGINELLKVLEHMGRFNEKYAEKRSSEEKKFMKWLNIITAKIKYFHLAKISNIEPHYKPALEEIRKIQIENVNTKPEDADVTSKKYRSEDNNPIDSQRKITNNSSKILKRCVSRTGDQCQDKYKHSTEIAEHGPVLSKIDRNPSHQNNIHISGTCNNKNSKSFSQTEAKNRLKCSSAIKNDNSEIATKRVQPQKYFDAVPEKPETNLIEGIINEIYLTHNRNARQIESGVQNLKRIPSVQNNSNLILNDQRTLASEKKDLQINGTKQNFSLKATDEFGSQNLKSGPCFTPRNFPFAVKREPNESSSENTLFQTSDAMFSGFLKKKIKTEVIEEEEEKDNKKRNEATITDGKSDVLQKSDCKFGITEAPKKKIPPFKFPNGFDSAIKRSKGILKPDVMKAFLIHVRRRKYPWKYAKIYDRDVSKIIEQLDGIVLNYYYGRTRSSSDDAQISWVMQLIKNLKEH